MAQQLRLTLKRRMARRREDFAVGPSNAAAVAALDAWPAWHGGCLVLVGPEGVGKSHLIAALAASADAASGAVLRLAAGQAFPADPFVAARLLCVDDADRLTAAQQAWLFTAFNHVVPAAGTVVVSGHTPPAQWPLRDDLRTRLGSGLTFEIVAIPQDALPSALASSPIRRYI